MPGPEIINRMMEQARTAKDRIEAPMEKESLPPIGIEDNVPRQRLIKRRWPIAVGRKALILAEDEDPKPSPPQPRPAGSPLNGEAAA